MWGSMLTPDVGVAPRKRANQKIARILRRNKRGGFE